MCGFFAIFKQVLLTWFSDVEDHAVWIGHKLSTNQLFEQCLTSVVQLELQRMSRSQCTDATPAVAMFVYFQLSFGALANRAPCFD